ncbi:hypothetical protein Fmac_004252 [Flemingia macrophylla]|uniref:TSL-kinase interacting protein 1 n=1 Tax=Flemingia macrophylla TaxID=520843 RepID=A0ABD1N4E6_9FABA
MTTGRSLNSNAAKASEKCNLKTGCIGVRKSPKRTNKLDHRARGRCQQLLTDKENQHFPFKEHTRMCPEIPNKVTFLTEKREAIELHSGEMITSAKIKLQLFPIDEGTRTVLEKDGHNPYLELTLNGRKKISSVLKHLGKKWGSSSIAKGELMLFPYNIMGNLSDCRRWTIKDSDTAASAVYAAVGSPAVFRLKYGWFCIDKPRSFGIPSAPIPDAPDVPVGGNANFEEGLRVEQDKAEISKKYKSIDVGNAGNETVAQKIDNAAVDRMDNEPRVSSSLQQSSSPWVDSHLNISIGGLLSEASLQGGLDSKLFAGIQPCEIATASLDAFFAAHIYNRPVSRLSSEDLRTSILDAEETCHAFPLQKLSSPTGAQTAYGKNNSLVCSQVNDQDEPLQNPPSGKTETDMLLSSRPYDDERSLGLTGINWNDSRGPFDLGMPAKLIGGDSVTNSIGGFVK